MTTTVRTAPHPSGAALDEPAFRQELRTFITAHHPGPEPADPASRLAVQRAWAATLHDHDWAAPSWPTKWGGMNLPLALLVPYHEEMALARVPSHPSPNAFIVGPTILAHGNDEQRARYLLPIVRGEELWCQGFSEPDAGSDLAALRTRADNAGDRYVVTGQKVWTSRAMTADWMFALVRTASTGHARADLTYLLIPLDAPGLTVRPVRDLTGGAYFGEVFFEQVAVPIAQRVGAEGDGWRLARTSLGHERSTSRVAMVIRYQRVVEELLRLARHTHRADDPIVRQRLADVIIGSRLLAITFERVMARVLEGSDPGALSSVSRLFLATFEQRLHELAIDLLGASGMLNADDAAAIEGGRWTWGFLNTRASTIGAGTAEIQRNTIAERLLELPREPR